MTNAPLTVHELFAALREICLRLDPIVALNSALRDAPDTPVSKIADIEDMAPLNKALDVACDMLQRGYKQGLEG